MGKKKKNEELVQYAEIDGTPFTVTRVWDDEKNKNEYYILVGKYRISGAMESEHQAIEEAKKVDWTKIMQVIGIFIKEQTHIVEEEEITNKKG